MRGQMQIVNGERLRRTARGFTSPEMAVGEGVAGAVFEVFLERIRILIIGESDGDNALPGKMLGCVFGASAVVVT